MESAVATHTDEGAAGTAIDLPPMVMVDGAPEGLFEGLPAVDVGDEGADEPLDVGCGTDGLVVGPELGFGVAGVDGLDEEPPSPIDRIGVEEDVGFELGSVAGAASLFTVELLDEEDGAGLNTPLTVVPSQLSGFHQVGDELALGVLLGAAAGAVETVVGAGAVGTPEGEGLAGAAPDGAEGCGVDGAEVGSGTPGRFGEPALVELELGAELGADDDGVVAPGLAAGFATGVEPAAQFADVCAVGVEEDELAAFATVGITATPVAARKTAGTPIAVTTRARLVCAASTRRTASAVSSGVDTTARGLFIPPPRERSGTSPGSGSGPASSANTPGTGIEPARRGCGKAARTALSPADPLA